MIYALVALNLALLGFVYLLIRHGEAKDRAHREERAEMLVRSEQERAKLLERIQRPGARPVEEFPEPSEEPVYLPDYVDDIERWEADNGGR